MLSHNPRVSIIMPAYNSASFIGDAVTSIRQQSYPDWELLIIDDGSLDNTGEICASFMDDRIRLIQNPTNLGIPMSTNIGMAVARGEYLARMDSDDIALPERLGAQVEFLDSAPEIAIVGSDAEVFGRHSFQTRVAERDPEIKANLLIRRNHVHNCTVMFRRSFVTEHRVRLNPYYVRQSDQGFWIECVRHGARFANIKRVLLRRRWHGGNISKTAAGITPRYSVQKTLVAEFFPNLAGSEVDHVVALFEINMAWDCQTANQSITTGLKALQETRSLYGENRAAIQHMLRHCVEKIETSFGLEKSE